MAKSANSFIVRGGKIFADVTCMHTNIQTHTHTHTHTHTLLQLQLDDITKTIDLHWYLNPEDQNWLFSTKSKISR